MKLRSKILLVLIPLVVIPLLVLGVIAFFQMASFAQRKTVVEMETRMDQVSLQIDSLLRTVKANVRLFSESVLVEKYLLTSDDWDRYSLLQPSLLRLFSSYRRAYPQYAEIRILLPDGYEDARMAEAHLPNVTEEEGETFYFREISESEEEVPAVFGPSSDDGRTVIYAGKRISLRDASQDPVSSDPVLRGYLVVTVSLDVIQEHLEKNRLGTSGHLFLTDESGKIVFHSDPGRIGMQLREELFKVLRESPEEMEMVLAMEETVPTLYSARPLANRLFLMASLPQSELLEDGRRLGLIVAAIICSAILFTVVLLYLFLRGILIRPIQSLGEAAFQIGKGNLECPIPIGSDDEIGQLAGSFREMSRNLSSSRERIRFLAYHDQLTGLPNRVMFGEYLTASIAHARRHNHSLALLFFDIDNFKRINETLGHHAGDRLLEQLSARLTHCLRREDYFSRPVPQEGSDTVARLGGDEFMLILTHLHDPLIAGTVAQRILGELNTPFQLEKHEIFITASIGITTYPADGEDPETLIKNADLAMYHAKEQGKNNFQYFADSMNAAVFERMTLENQLRRALERKELLLHYQPLIDARTGRMAAMEALMRWRHPEMGMIFPGRFITIAEDSGLMIPMGEWSLRTACLQVRDWIRRGLKPVPMAVNLSPTMFRNPHLDRMIGDILRETSVDPHLLEVELTESVLMQEEEQATGILQSLRAMGVRVALDDFGTGYSSLSYLRRFPIDTLKIDQSFVRDIHEGEDSSIVRAIIALAHGLNLTVTAEGVEQEFQADFLRGQNCDILQGYLFSRPIPPEEIPPWLSR